MLKRAKGSLAGIVNSPVVPAILLLHGVTLGIVGLGVTETIWSQWMTVALYGGVAIWVSVVVAVRIGDLLPLSMIDVAFSAFILVVAVSTTRLWVETSLIADGLRFAPFMVLVPFAAGRVASAREVRMIATTIAWLAAILLPFCVVEILENWHSARRITLWGVEHAVLLSGLLVGSGIGAMLGCRLALEQSCLRSRMGWWLGFVGATVVLGLIGARGATIATVVAMCCVLGLAQWVRGAKRLAVLGVFVGALGVSVLLSPSGTWELWVNAYNAWRTGTSEDVGVTDCRALAAGEESIAIRKVILGEAVRLFAQRPIAGVGAGQYGAHACSGAFPGVFPHSTALQTLAELGLLGALPLVFLVWMAVRTCVHLARASPKSDSGIAAAFLMPLIAFYLITDQFYGDYFMSTGTYLFAGIAAGMNARRSESGRRKELD